MFSQLCVWPGTVLKNDTKSIEEFVQYISTEFDTRVRYETQTKTLPDIHDDKIVEGTGGRNDILFYVHKDDVMKFSLPRFKIGVRWWEDIFFNNNQHIYEDDILAKYQPMW